MRHPTRRRAAAAAAAAAGLLWVGACTGDTTASPERSPDAGASSSPADDDTMEGATGPRVEGPGYAFNLPAGWIVDEARTADGDVRAGAGNALAAADNMLSLRYGADSPYDTIEEMAGQRMKILTSSFSPRVRRGETMDVAGVEAAVASGPRGIPGSRVTFLGMLHQGDSVELILITEGGRGVSRETVASMVATWDWR